MNPEPDLFSYPSSPGYKAAGPSAEAAVAASSEAETLRGLCVEVLSGAALTADEVAARLGRSILSIRPRLSELRARARITDTGLRRANASGKRATVWKLNN